MSAARRAVVGGLFHPAARAALRTQVTNDLTGGVQGQLRPTADSGTAGA